MMPVASATMPAANQTIAQIWLSDRPTDSAAWWSSATARSARPMRVRLKNTASPTTMTMAMTAAAMSMCWRMIIPFSPISIVVEPVGRPSCPVGHADRRHQQDDLRLVDQRSHDEALDADRQQRHHRDGQRQRQPGGHAFLVEPHQRQAGEHHHDALGEVEHARRLEDQHEAERDERIEDPRDEAFPDDLQQEIGHRRHIHERLDENGFEQIQGWWSPVCRQPASCGNRPSMPTMMR